MKGVLELRMNGKKKKKFNDFRMENGRKSCDLYFLEYILKQFPSLLNS